MQTISITLNGRDRLIAQWPHPTNGDSFALVKRAQLAAQGFALASKAIAEDPRRTPMAQREDTEAAAVERLRELAAVHADLRKLRADADAHRRQALAIKPAADAGQVLIDLAVAQRFRELENRDAGQARAALRLGADRQLVEALSRTPTFLHGANADAVASAQVALLHREQPSVAAALDSRQAELADAGAAVARAFELVGQAGAVGLEGRIAAAGEGWGEMVSTHPAAGERIAERAAAEAA